MMMMMMRQFSCHIGAQCPVSHFFFAIIKLAFISFHVPWECRNRLFYCIFYSHEIFILLLTRAIVTRSKVLFNFSRVWKLFRKESINASLALFLRHINNGFSFIFSFRVIFCTVTSPPHSIWWLRTNWSTLIVLFCNFHTNNYSNFLRFWLVPLSEIFGTSPPPPTFFIFWYLIVRAFSTKHLSMLNSLIAIGF